MRADFDHAAANAGATDADLDFGDHRFAQRFGRSADGEVGKRIPVESRRAHDRDP